MKDIIIFTICFLGINLLIFTPSWIIGVVSKNENSKKTFFKDSIYTILKKVLYKRTSDDGFRFIFEIQILTLLTLLTNKNNTIFLESLIVLLTVLSFSYVTYIAIIIKVFKKNPILINDIDFVKTGIMVYRKKISLFILSLFFAIALVSITSNILVEILFDVSYQIEQKWILIIPLSLSIILSLFSLKKEHYAQYHNCVSFSLIKHFALNIKKCNVLKRSLKTLNTESPYNSINQIVLQKQPNIIFVFLESYGRFALSDNRYSEELQRKMNKIYSSITKKQWQVVSSFSKSPVFSGGSWLSQSSVFFGAKVKDMAAHELIFNQTDYVSKLESLPKYLSKLGYKTTITSTLSYKKNEVNWEKVKNAYPFDNMMLIDEFNYTGKGVSIFGDRFTLPDEYTLNYAYNDLKKKSPFFLSIITTNSHYNFISPIKAKKHWKDYNTEDFLLTDGLKKNNLENYFKSINYHFDYLEKFLIDENPDDTMMVLIGDHQPPFITPTNATKDTPIHIISKNKMFTDAFKTFGFNDGLIPNNTVKPSKHQSLFSKFLYALNKAYGLNKEQNLPILEDGIALYK